MTYFAGSLPEKLRTLKDLEEIRINDTKGVLMVEDPLVFKRDLKQEAIKWIKKLDERNWGLKFRNFHNITEEDLEKKE